MAELNVQPKRSNPWWLWVLLILVIVGVLSFLVKGCNDKNTRAAATADSTSTKK